MVAFSTWQSLHTDLIRKAVGGSLFFNSSTTTVLANPLSTVAGGALPALPSGWVDAGLMDDNGMQWDRSVNLAEVTSFGQATATRTDVQQDTETCHVVFQETNKTTITMFTGVDPTALVVDATSGELDIVKPNTPPQRTYQILGVAQDTNNSGDIYIMKYFPYATVTSYGSQGFQKDGALTWDVTLQAKLHPTAGYAVRWIFSGPGFNALKTSMGL